MCQRGARKLSPVVAEIQVPVLQGDPGTGPVTVDVGCPGKLRAVSGGFRGSANVTEGVSLPQDSFKKGKRTWRSTGFAIGDPSGATHRQFTSIGYCSRRGRDVEAQSAAVLPAPELSSAFTSPCARRPLTGGFAVSPFDPSGGGVVLLASKPVGTGWEVRGTNLFGPGPAALSAFAYCR